MILTDAGALVAVLDDDDQHNREALEIVQRLPVTPLITTWPCFTEAMHLLGGLGGYSYQAPLWHLNFTGRL